MWTLLKTKEQFNIEMEMTKKKQALKKMGKKLAQKKLVGALNSKINQPEFL